MGKLANHKLKFLLLLVVKAAGKMVLDKYVGENAGKICQFIYLPAQFATDPEANYSLLSLTYLAGFL